ncbi:beta-amylase 1, chloroplastic-like [Gossypium australe]|uniref:Beta-amylase 1, chloroplastic-like n=1 Tax=Gossypium australe TaxID=47621 RepID=A0A5B6VN26_9ROSI|nr:beta-amylase 1, chloroplastic-like [Gossypium australe]
MSLFEDGGLLVELQVKPTLVSEIKEKQPSDETEGKVRLIQDRLKVASNRQKLYADQKRKDVEFSIGDRVYSERITKKESYEVRQNLSFEEEPVRILDREVISVSNVAFGIRVYRLG